MEFGNDAARRPAGGGGVRDAVNRLDKKLKDGRKRVARFREKDDPVECGGGKRPRIVSGSSRGVRLMVGRFAGAPSHVGQNSREVLENSSAGLGDSKNGLTPRSAVNSYWAAIDATSSRVGLSLSRRRTTLRSNCSSPTHVTATLYRADRRFEHPRRRCSRLPQDNSSCRAQGRTDGGNRRLAERTDPVAESRSHTLIPSPIDGPRPPVPRRRDWLVGPSTLRKTGSSNHLSAGRPAKLK